MNGKLARKVADRLRDATCKWFRMNAGYSSSSNAKAVVGISGGKDSSVVAAICANALGPGNVVGVMMPNGNGSGSRIDFDDSKALVEHLGIRSAIVNIGGAYDSLMELLDSTFGGCGLDSDAKVTTNLPARLRMCVLYAVAAHENGRVVGTSNLSEQIIGWGTLWGDTACDFNPIADLYADEVVAVGEALGLPERFTRKPPSDGMCGKTDEEAFGFTYGQLRQAIRTDSRRLLPRDVALRVTERVYGSLFKQRLLAGIPCVELSRGNDDEIEL